MNLLAIDPGPAESAFVWWADDAIVESGKVSNERLLESISDTHAAYIDRCAIEMIASYGMPVGREVFETCVWIGRIMEAFGAERCDRLTRIEIKSHLCNSAKAKDGNIRQAIIDRMGPPGTKKAPGATYGISGDVWSALAVALTWMDKHGVVANAHSR
jgi:hypothetical protein